MQLFYHPHINSGTDQFVFDKIESRHIVKVLRKKEGDLLFITNGDNALYTSKIVIANDKKCRVQIISEEVKEKSWDYYLHIAIAPTKNNDRLEWFLEKATEIGIDEITPLICNHSERKIIKKERLEKVLVSAMKQSLKFKLPKFNDAIDFSTFIRERKSGDLYIAHCENGQKETLKSQLKPRQKLTLLIGPEGDFSLEEIKQAHENGFTPISLGDSRLRTETAGIAVTQSVAFFNQE